MLTVAIRDFRAIERADFTIDRLTLVSGQNGAGKSSVLNAVALALTRQVVPHYMKKGEAGALVRVGQSAGGTRIKTPQGELTVAYPKATATANGTQPVLSPFAAGLVAIPDMDSKKRSLALGALLKTEPTKEELAGALTDIGYDAKGIDAVWKALSDNGWDATHKKASDFGATLKGQWQQITGENYGSAKAAGWAPTDLTGIDGDIETLTGEHAAAKANLETAIAATAGDEAKIAEWKTDADELPDLTIENAAKQNEIGALEADLADFRVKRAAIPDEGKPAVVCPHCEAPIAIKNNAGSLTVEKVEQAKPLTTAQLAKVRKERAEIDGSIANVTGKIAEARKAQAEIAGRVSVAKAADFKLAEENAKPKAEGLDIDACRKAEADAIARLNGAKAKNDAAAIHARIERNQATIAVLAPEGLRKRRLSNSVDTFNSAILGPVWQAAKWKPVTVSESLDCQYGGRDYDALSESEQMRVRIAFQIACAQIDGSDLVVIDRADILDKAGRGGLINAIIKAWKKPALVAMTYSEERLLPPLDKLGGQVFWLDGGHMRLVEPARVAA